MVMTYIYTHNDWPKFRWNGEKLAPLLADIRHRQGRLLGRMESLGFRFRGEANLSTLTDDIVKSNAIEGAILDPQAVRSSLARRLGLDTAGTLPASRDIEGQVEMMLDATQKYAEPLTSERLFAWHAALFPAGRSGMRKITVGAWRPAEAGPMQVVSGGIGREKVHFEAPKAGRLDAEMMTFLKWFNTPPGPDAVLKAALAHFWFVTIHPFEDGNGRIARAIADMALARADGIPDRYYSMSSQIEAERKDYYQILEASQKGDLDVTAWMMWFLECMGRALDRASSALANVMRKARFLEAIHPATLNDRQWEMVNRLLDGFEGNLTTSKYAKLERCSTDTALRDIRGLLERDILIENQGRGRSASYRLSNIEKETINQQGVI